MSWCTVYYDDSRSSCREYVEIFEGYEGVLCKPASEYVEYSLIYEENSVVGFVFESDKDNVPYCIRHIFWRIIMSKKGQYFLAVTGGNRELTAIRCAVEDMEVRGYEVSNVYSKYMFEKYRMELELCVGKIVADMENGEAQFRIYAQAVRGMSRKELRKMLRSELKEYKEHKKYRKKLGM